MLSTRIDQFPSPNIFNMPIAHDVDVTLRDFSGWDALLHACRRGSPDSVRSLLSLKKPFAYGKLRLDRYRAGTNILTGPFQSAIVHTSDKPLRTLFEFTEVEEVLKNDWKFLQVHGSPVSCHQIPERSNTCSRRVQMYITDAQLTGASLSIPLL